MDQLTSDLSRISIEKSSTRKEQVLQQLRTWLSDNPDAKTILSLTRRANITTAFMATLTFHKEALPKDVQVYLREREARHHSIEEWDLLAKLDLAEFTLAMFSSDPSKERGLNDGSEKNRPLEWRVEVLHQAFNQEPRGRVVQDFLDALSKYAKLHNSVDYFGKIIAILQSSAFGKTFLMWQIRNHILSVTVCLRTIHKDIRIDGLQPEDGWPPQDQQACTYFREMTKRKPLMGEEAAGAFLGALFHVMLDKLNESQSLESFNAHWNFSEPRTPLESPRHAAFTLIREKAMKLLDTHSETLLGHRGSMPIPGQHSATRSADVWHTLIYGTLIKDVLTELVALYMHLRLGEHIAIAFDECTQLNEFGHDPSDYNPQSEMSLIALRRMMKTCESHPVWFLLLDTSSSTTALHPSVEEAESARLRSTHLLLPPWSYFGFDLLDRSMVLPNPNDALRLTNLKWYGRPYWSSLPDDYIVPGAMWKLFGTPYVPAKLTLDQVLAVFSARILVALANTNAASVLAANAVRKHMRLFLGVIDRSVIRSSVPSEPALAIAAAVGLLKSPPRMANYAPAIETFVKELILRKDLLDKGSIGELIARFFLTIARDAALEGRPFVSDLLSVNTVPLSQLLSNLVQHTMPTALYSFAQRYVTNFTHFYQLSETIFDLSPKFLHHCWCRGVALQGVHGQPLWDVIIPAYRKDDLDRPFDPEHICLLVIQVKNRVAPSSASVKHLTAPFITADGASPRKKPPHIALLMDLGTTSAFGTSTGPRIMIEFSKAEPPLVKKAAVKDANASSAASIRDHYFSSSYPEHDRWAVQVRGHRMEEYHIVAKYAPDLLKQYIWDEDTGLVLQEYETRLVKETDPLGNVEE
ncbi:hypothetical protein BDN71DRAFT_1585721 [Pleurotus eryngii]|uniref:Uncharacterized protein n=1 Tax=Pleurotus eryngii TaxID=5323 RepID=A0A9P6AA63_PLEER|nr:hypothetical protein BDN71DRAFT_1585721 [Pleurotus eryngii]